MKTLYVSQQGCYLCLDSEIVLVKYKNTTLQEVKLPHLEQILVFGHSQVTTQLIRECLNRDIPIAFLSRMGYCYGRIIPIERGYRHLAKYQQQLLAVERLLVARQMIFAKIKNSRIILQRRYRNKPNSDLQQAIDRLNHYAEQALKSESIEQLFGIEGISAATYFSVFSSCLSSVDFVFTARSKRPPGNPVNAMLSFGYQVLWNHLLALIEITGLDPYNSFLHQGSEKHAALVSDLIEEFRAPIVDSLVIYLVNRKLIHAVDDFEYRDGGCFLNNSGRKKFLKVFLQRMEETVSSADEEVPKWDILGQQVRELKRFIYEPCRIYSPYLIK